MQQQCPETRNKPAYPLVGRFNLLREGIPVQTLESIVYVSSATHAFSEDELQQLLQTVRKTNRDAGVTGVLLHSDGNFIQALEGPPEALAITMQRIKASHRHHGLVELHRDRIEAREFADWDMGARRVDSERLIDAQNDPGTAKELLKSLFYGLR